MPMEPRVKYHEEADAYQNAEAHYGDGSYAGHIINKFGPVLSPRVQDSIFREHGTSLAEAREQGFKSSLYTGKAYRHAHVYDVLDHLGY